MEGFNQTGASVISIPVGERTCDYEKQRIAVQGMVPNNPENLARYGFFGPELRAKKGGKVAASPLFTTESLGVQRDGTKVINSFLGLSTEQIPAVMLVKPTQVEANPEKSGSTIPYWSFIHSDASAKTPQGYVPAALVALSPVKVHFIAHPIEKAAEWEARLQAGKTKTTTLLGLEARKKFESGTEGQVHEVTLAQGDVFVTHSGMPLYCSAVKQGEDYVVQAVSVNVLKPGNKRRVAWVLALTEKGAINESKFGSVLFAGIIGKNVDDLDAAPRVTAVATEASVPWLTAAPTAAAKRKKATPAVIAAAASASPPASPAATAGGGGGDKKKRRETITVDGVEILSSLQTQFQFHLDLEARIAALQEDAPDVWDPKLEAVVQKHREKLKQQLTSASSKDINSYNTTLKSLDTNIKKAEDLVAKGEGESKYEAAKRVLEECGTILAELEIPEIAKKEKGSHESCKKFYAELLNDGGRYFKRDVLDKFLGRCKDLVTAVEARVAAAAEGRGRGTKRSNPSSPPASSLGGGGGVGGGGGGSGENGAHDYLPVDVDVDSLEDIFLAGGALGEHLMTAISKVSAFVESVNAGRADLNDAVETLKEEVNSAVSSAQEHADVEYNVNKINAYIAAIEASLAGPIASAPRPGKQARVVETKSGPVKFAVGNKSITCTECNESRNEYADGQCEECFKELFEDRVRVLDDHEDAFKAVADAAKEERLKVSRTNTKLTEPEVAYEAYMKLAREISGLLRKFYSNKSVFGQLVAAVEKAEDLVIATLGHLEDPDEDEAAGVDLGDEEGSSPFGADDDDEVVYEDEDEDEDEEESDHKKKNGLKKRSRGSGGDEGEEEEEEDANTGLTKKTLLLADRFLRVSSRAPVEKVINEIRSLYEKGDPNSLTAAEVAISKLENLKVVWALKVVNGFEYPYVFETEEDAEGKSLFLSKKVPGANFEVYQKNLE